MIPSIFVVGCKRIDCNNVLPNWVDVLLNLSKREAFLLFTLLSKLD